MLAHAAAIFALQRTVGNRAVSELLAKRGQQQGISSQANDRQDDSLYVPPQLTAKHGDKVADSAEIYTTPMKHSIQRYSEQESTSQHDIDAVWAARQRIGITARSKRNHNVAVDYNNSGNYARSAKNGHAEMFVSNAFNVSRGNKRKLNIVSERQPCGACEADLRHLEQIANPNLDISVDYFIQYEEGAGGDALWEYYFPGSSSSSESDSDSE